MGFYADVDANCKIYHTCDDHGNKFSYRCPEETAFRQDALICDHAHLVDCHATKDFTNLEESNKSETLDTGLPSVFASGDIPDIRRSYSRSFQVIQHPDKSASNKIQPGFVFSASVFLRDRDESRNNKKPLESRSIDVTESSVKPSFGFQACDVSRGKTNPKNDVIAAFSTARPFSDRFDLKAITLTDRFPNFHAEGRQFRKDEPRKSFQTEYSPPFLALHGRTSVNKTEPNRSILFDAMNRNNDAGIRVASFGQVSGARKGAYSSVTSSWDRKDSSSDLSVPSVNPNSRDYPYFETLRSIQANSRLMSTTTSTTPRTQLVTTEIPVHALTMSLKPLVPNALEYDPYYPKLPTSTEAYYTPSHSVKGHVPFRFSTQAPWSTVNFEIPSILPDLNTLEDLVDRRKLFYIPRIKST